MDTREKVKLSRIEWLAENGFKYDPFEAEARRAEGDNLLKQTDVFVDFPYGNEVIGSINRPGPRFIFANRGCGKTSLRLSIERKFDDTLKSGAKSPVLVVSYCNFDTVLAKAGDNPSAVKPRDHVGQIISLILDKLFETLTDETQSHSDFLKEKINNDATRKLFLWYIDRFGALHPWELDRLIAKIDGIRSFFSGKVALEFAKTAANLANETVAPSSWQKIIRKFLDLIKLPIPVQIDDENISLKTQLEDILKICQEFGFSGIYILVDDVDELQYYGSNEDFESTFLFISSLASVSKILSIPSLVFKFFLPNEIREMCLSTLRFDIFGSRTVEWDTDSLKKLLQQRLKACWDEDNETGPEISLTELCDDEDIQLKYIDEMLVSFASKKHSPRALIYMGNELLAEHFRFSLREKDDKIEFRAWERAFESSEEVL